MADIHKFPAVHHVFSPYEFNSGTVAAIAGADFVVIGADTCLKSGGVSHNSRSLTKLFKLSPGTVIGATGCFSDALSLTNVVRTRIRKHECVNFYSMSTDVVAQLLSDVMYKKRFLPYTLSNVLVGLDYQGKGAVYSYDRIGRYERNTYKASGTSAAFLQLALEKHMSSRHMKLSNLYRKQAVSILSGTFMSATANGIYTGDSLIITTITKNGTEQQTVDL